MPHVVVLYRQSVALMMICQYLNQRITIRIVTGISVLTMWVIKVELIVLTHKYNEHANRDY